MKKRIVGYLVEAVHRRLAMHQDIIKAINQHIPISFRDLRNSSEMAAIGKSLTIYTLVLINLVSVLTYRFYVHERYNTIARTRGYNSIQKPRSYDRI